MLGVKTEKITLDVGLDAQEGGRVFFVSVDLRERNVPRRVQLAGAESEFLALRGFARVKIDFVEAHVRGVPIMRIFLHEDVLVILPLAKTKRPVAHEGRTARPLRGAVIETRAAALD